MSGPGTFVGSPTCTYTGGGATASCTVTISSATTGTTVVSATSNIPVSGLSDHPHHQHRRRTPQPAAAATPTRTGRTPPSRRRCTTRQNNDITNTTVDAGHRRARRGDGREDGRHARGPSRSDRHGDLHAVRQRHLQRHRASATDANKPLTRAASRRRRRSRRRTRRARSRTSRTTTATRTTRHTTRPCEPFSDEATPTGQIAPTQTTCGDVLNGTAPTLGQVNYIVIGRQDRPEHQPGRVLLLLEDHDDGAEPGRDGHAVEHEHEQRGAVRRSRRPGVAVVPGDCSSKLVGTTFGPNDSGASFTVPTPGNYIIGIKYRHEVDRRHDALRSRRTSPTTSRRRSAARPARSVLLKKQ